MYKDKTKYIEDINKIDEQILSLLAIRQDIYKSYVQFYKSQEGGESDFTTQRIKERMKELVKYGKQKNLPSKFVRRFVRTVFHYFSKLDKQIKPKKEVS